MGGIYNLQNEFESPLTSNSSFFLLFNIYLSSFLTLGLLSAKVSNDIPHDFQSCSPRMGALRALLSDLTWLESAFILTLFEYCYPVWMSAADCHMKLLLRNFRCLILFLKHLILVFSTVAMAGINDVYFI